MEMRARQKCFICLKTIENKGFQLFIKNQIYVEYTYLIPTEFKKQTTLMIKRGSKLFYVCDHFDLSKTLYN